jgi:hypothetical protein
MLQVIVGRAKILGAEELQWEAFSMEELVALSATQSLLGDAKKYLLRGALNSEREAEFLDAARALASSPHLFVFEEEKLLKAPTTKLEKAGATIEVKKEKSGATTSARPSGFDPFGLTAALAARDRKKLWLGITHALNAGEKPEALCGILAWKARQMKSVKLSRELTALYHDSHRGAGDLELLLERFALTL